jgi:hypothetical protein
MVLLASIFPSSRMGRSLTAIKVRTVLGTMSVQNDSRELAHGSSGTAAHGDCVKRRK